VGVANVNLDIHSVARVNPNLQSLFDKPNYTVVPTQSLAVKQRLDNQKPELSTDVTIENPQRFSFTSDKTRDFSSGTSFLIGIPINGIDQPFRISLKDTAVAGLVSQCLAAVVRERSERELQEKKEAAEAFARGQIWQLATPKPVGIPREACTGYFPGGVFFLRADARIRVLEEGNDAQHTDWLFAIVDENGIPRKDSNGTVIQCQYTSQIFKRMFVPFSANRQQQANFEGNRQSAQGGNYIMAGDEQWNHMLTFCPTRPDPSICLNTHYRVIAADYTRALNSGSVPSNRVSEIRSRITYACDRYRPQTEAAATMQDGTQFCPIYRGR
jgi:hypothetical protein